MIKKILVLLAILVLTTTCVKADDINTNTDAVLQYNQGIDYYKLGQYDSAIVSFKNAINLDSNYIDAYYNLGSVLEYLQQYDAALAVFKQIIVRQPNDYDSIYKAAWLSNRLGDPAKAKTFLSIIPLDCERAQDAQELARQLNFNLNQNTISQTPKSSPIEQSSNLYQNISAPTGITSDKSGNIYVAEFNNNSIIKITPDNKRIVFVKDPKISGPIGLAYDKVGNIYIANYNKDNVLKVSTLGEISVLIGNVKKPYCLYIDGNILFISSQGSDSVLKYKLGN